MSLWEFLIPSDESNAPNQTNRTRRIPAAWKDIRMLSIMLAIDDTEVRNRTHLKELQ
jgi:hypothetical protein